MSGPGAGGVAGIRAALDMANAGFPVVLVEKQPSLGGNMARLSETFPTLDCSQCILTPLMVEASRHPKIEILTHAEVEEVNGFVPTSGLQTPADANHNIDDGLPI